MVADGPNDAVANGRDVGSYDSGMCQKYVRDQCWRVPSLYGSAIDAWNGARFKHPGDRTPPKGAPVYYRGGNYGHAVIWVGDNIRSTDCTSAYDVSEAAISWVENNWGYTYLGWTEDINGVTVIHEQGDDDVKEEDIAKIAARINHTLGDWNSDGELDGDTKKEDADLADQRLRQIENVVRNIKADVDKILKAVT